MPEQHINMGLTKNWIPKIQWLAIHFPHYRHTIEGVPSNYSCIINPSRLNLHNKPVILHITYSWLVLAICN